MNKIYQHKETKLVLQISSSKMKENRKLKGWKNPSFPKITILGFWVFGVFGVIKISTFQIKRNGNIHQNQPTLMIIDYLITSEYPILQNIESPKAKRTVSSHRHRIFPHSPHTRTSKRRFQIKQLQIHKSKSHYTL